MDGIQNVPASGVKYVHYGNKTFVDVSDQIQKYEGPLTADQLSVYAPSTAEKRQSWRPYFTSGRMLADPAISQDYREIEAQMDDAVDRFFAGDLTEDGLSETFYDLLGRLSDACDQNGYPTPLGAGIYGDQARADQFYSEYRLKILNKAVGENYREGLQYAAHGENGNWQYYNSDYYYTCESGLSAIKNGVMKYCQEKGYSDFSPTPRRQEWKLEVVDYNYYEDFNSAWSHAFGSSQTFLDGKQAPPRGVAWFFETGGSGKIRFVGEQKGGGAVFDSEDPLSARMWVSYQDEDGNTRKSETAFSFDGTRADLKKAASLLTLASSDSALLSFLRNLQVFSPGYFAKYPAARVDIRI